MISTPPPHSLDELLSRAYQLSGLSLGEVAQKQGFLEEPKHKGWTGQLLEKALGANAGSQSEPDFLELGVELKTIPMTPQGIPQESTFICAISANPELQWEGSTVQKKLAQVLWIPIVGVSRTVFLERRIGAPFLWIPSKSEENLLRRDFEELTEFLYEGKIDQLTAFFGEALQVRPKAADSTVQISTVNADGEKVLVSPRGFYLRKRFTQNLFAKVYLH